MKLIKNIWLDGKYYESQSNTEFISKFKKIPLITYRIGFDRIYPSELESDVGWGCMIRSGQMMLANCFCKLINCENKTDYDKKYLEILEKFNDNVVNPYSIHNISTVGSYMGVQIGSWFGPTITSLALQLINNEEYNSDINITVFQDGIIEKDVLNLIVENNKNNLILLPIMLGLESISDKYKKILLKLFEFPLFSGIIGGKPKTSLYFVGKSNDELLYLDPHTVKNYKKNINLDDYVSKKFEFISINDLDPSMVLGFLIKSSSDYELFTEYINNNFISIDFPICIGNKKNVDNIEFHKQENDWELISQ